LVFEKVIVIFLFVLVCAVIEICGVGQF
jgi:hypothetical protein